VLGVTGPYCAGKDTVVSILRDSNFSEIDVDRVGHRVLEVGEVKEMLRETFGAEVFSGDGAVDRRLLGRRVFNDVRELRKLEAIVHPPMVVEVERTLERVEGAVVINAAVLFRMGLQRICHAVICVQAPFFERLRRARRRDGAGFIQVLRRMRAQRGICPKFKSIDVDIYYVDNDRGLGHLHTQILKILREKGHTYR
jgi:dephospho-CoA kinase